MTVDLRTSKQIKACLTAAVTEVRNIIGRGTWSVIQNADQLDHLNDTIDNDLQELRDRGDATDRPREEITA